MFCLSFGKTRFPLSLYKLSCTKCVRYSKTETSWQLQWFFILVSEAQFVAADLDAV